MPPLRKRRGDVLLLARHFTDHFALKLNKGSIVLDARAQAALEAYSCAERDCRGPGEYRAMYGGPGAASLIYRVRETEWGGRRVAHAETRACPIEGRRGR